MHDPICNNTAVGGKLPKIFGNFWAILKKYLLSCYYLGNFSIGLKLCLVVLGTASKVVYMDSNLSESFSAKKVIEKSKD